MAGGGGSGEACRNQRAMRKRNNVGIMLTPDVCVPRIIKNVMPAR